MTSQSDIKDQQLIRDLLLENKALERNNQMLKVELDNQLRDYGYLSDCLENELKNNQMLKDNLQVEVQSCNILMSELKFEQSKSNELMLSFQNKESELKSLQKGSDFWKSEYENAVKVLKRQLIMDKGLKEDKTQLKTTINDLTDHVEKLRKELIDMTSQRDEFKAKAIGIQEDLAHWHGKYFDLVRENKEKSKVSYSSENKVNLSQSEIDFLKSYLSQCLTDTAENIADLKADAKRTDVPWYSNELYKTVNKLKKKFKVLSGIQHRLKKTVLNRKAQATPQGNQEGYAGHKRAWIAVCDAIEVYYPGFLSERGTGIECAVRAVHALGATKEQWNKLQNEIQNIMTLNLKGIK